MKTILFFLTQNIFSEKVIIENIAHMLFKNNTHYIYT